jgi:hypothetical protein
VSRLSELDICISELRTAASALSSAADTLERLFSSPEEKEAPAPVTKEQVRSVLSQKSTAGHSVAVRALLKDFGATQLSDVDPDRYADIIQAATAIGAAGVQQDG